MKTRASAFMVPAAILMGMTLSPARADDGSEDDDVFVIGALGDSLSAAFNARRYGDNREYSWSTGQAKAGFVNSHYDRLQSIQDGPVAARNEATAGARSSELRRQVRRLQEHEPDYVTMTIGANDVCNWQSNYKRSLHRFRSRVATAIDRLINSKPDIKIFVSPIPDLNRLWEVAEDRPSCQMKWDLMHVCDPLLASDRTPDERERFAKRWEKANAALADVAETHAENVKFEQELAEIPFEWRHVSQLDCFHPNLAGQDLLSEMTWRASWYAGE